MANSQDAENDVTKFAIRPALRLAVNRRVVDGPFGFAYLDRRSNMRPLLPRKSSSVYVDGFPRSANSYVFYAFKVANPNIEISGHCHSAAAIRKAVELSVPVFLTVREPRGCLASFTQFVPSLPLAEAMHHYLRFYERVLPLRDSIFVADFHDVTVDLGEAMCLMNRNLGTSLEPYLKTQQQEEEVEFLLDQSNRRYARGAEHTTPRPSDDRRDAESLLLDLSARQSRLMDECASLYAELLAT